MRIFSKRNKAGLAGLVLVAGVAITAVAYAAATFGPSRPTYTWAHPATHITFNSITDNPDPSIGDERYFVSARDAASSDKLSYFKNLNVSDNEEMIVRVFYHNNASSNLNLVAQNTQVKINLPTTPSNTVSPTAYITADNATPNQVWSTMDFTNSQPFTLEYEPGTAQIWNQKLTGTHLSDSVVGSGALIGYDKIDGKISGCSQFSGYVTVKVRVHVKEQPKPAFSCDLLNVTVGDNRKVDASVNFTAKNGASLSNVNFNWGDGNSENTGTTTSASHSYAKDGTYTIDSKLTFNVGDTTATAVCSKTVTFSTPHTPHKPHVPVAPPVLPNTGAGSVAAIFAGVSVLAGLGHYVFSRRRA